MESTIPSDPVVLALDALWCKRTAREPLLLMNDSFIENGGLLGPVVPFIRAAVEARRVTACGDAALAYLYFRVAKPVELSAERHRPWRREYDGLIELSFEPGVHDQALAQLDDEVRYRTMNEPGSGEGLGATPGGWGLLELFMPRFLRRKQPAKLVPFHRHLHTVTTAWLLRESGSADPATIDRMVRTSERGLPRDAALRRLRTSVLGFESTLG